jgi:ubiquinone/menaquinone biosynthesis C-methylase UbiE
MGGRNDEHAPSVTGFDYDRVSADDYDSYRPSYAPEAVDWLVRTAGLKMRSRVVDVAAGTGKLTRLLVGAGLDVVVIEPSAKMRAKLVEVTAGVEVLDGTAESIPLADASVDCVTVGQAFHHFHAREALEEIGRVLRQNGALALFWNVYARDSPEKTKMDEIIDRYIDPSSAVCAAFGTWPRAFEDKSGFTSIDVREFPHAHELPAARLSTVLATSSDIASLPIDRRMALLAEVDAWAAGLPEHLAMPAITRVDLFARK